MKKLTRLFAIAMVMISTSLILNCSDSDSDSSTEVGNNTTPTVNNYVLPTTGQVKAYDNSEELTNLNAGDAFYGQDGNYLKGSEMSYTDNGDGTVTDQVTGQMWQQVPSSQSFTWQEAVDYCNDLELSGYDDWRIPTAKELFAISNFSTGWPYIDQTYFTLASGEISKDEQYWTANFYESGTTHGGQASAFGVNHVTGHIKAYPSEVGGPMGNFVRAIRGDVYGTNDFIDNSNGTITDANTNLMWMQNDNETVVDWENALTYADTIEYAGHSDWRLPNVKELQSIVDYGKTVHPAIDDLFSCTPIINEAGVADFGYYWTSTSAYFGVQDPNYYYAWYVAFGKAVDDTGEDTHGAGAVRFDTKVEDGPNGEGGERYYNYVRLVRDVEE